MIAAISIDADDGALSLRALSRRSTAILFTYYGFQDKID